MRFNDNPRSIAHEELLGGKHPLLPWQAYAPTCCDLKRAFCLIDRWHVVPLVHSRSAACSVLEDKSQMFARADHSQGAN